MDHAFMHELIHIAIPLQFISSHQERCEEYENTIDKIAERYTRDKDFMDYAKRRIPIIVDTRS